MNKRALACAVMVSVLAGFGCGSSATSGVRNAACPAGPLAGSTTPSGGHAIKTVFVIVMENHDWSSIRGSSQASYVNDTLLPMASRNEEYFNPPGNHPSLPNYLWMVGGQNFGVTDDNNPSSHKLATVDHLAAQLTAAGISWKSYQEDITGTDCPLTPVNKYAPKHNPFVYFADVTDNFSASSANCIAHVRPLPELESDLANGTAPRFAFITPNLCDDMHDCGVDKGDAFLANWVPKIQASQAYQDGGALFVTFDEGGFLSDGPVGMLVTSPLAKGNNYASCVLADHSSFLRTLQEIYGVGPFLGDALNASDLSDLFTTFP